MIRHHHARTPLQHTSPQQATAAQSTTQTTPCMLGQRRQMLTLAHHNTRGGLSEGNGCCVCSRALHMCQLKNFYPPWFHTPCTYQHLGQPQHTRLSPS